MKNERGEPQREGEDRGNERPLAPGDVANRDRRGPFTAAAGWLGAAFDRTRINHREAEDRRRRNM